MPSPKETDNDIPLGVEKSDLPRLPDDVDTNDITSKDIANLYSRLQSVIDKVPMANEPNPEPRLVPLPLSPNPSSHMWTNQAPIQAATPRSSDEKMDECPCHHILVSKESKHCSLCNRVIPVLEELQNERDTHTRELESLQTRLAEEQDKIQKQLDEIETLNAKIGDVEQRLGVKTEEFQALQKDMELLNDKYVDEIERVAEIQHSKDMVESELEDLSRRLFEEANGMVANEKREKYNLEKAQKHLENQLAETRERLQAEQMQLKELRKKMEEMQTDSPTMGDGASHFSGSAEGSTASSTPLASEHRSMNDMAELFHTRTTAAGDVVGVDKMMLDEFEEFVKNGKASPLKKLHTSSSFMKYCQAEDVESCLRFGPHSRLSARKINEAIVLNTCFIEEAPPGFAEEQARRPVDEPLKISAAKTMIWERFSNTSQNPFSGCQACGRNDGTPLPYRFRISYFDDWACIDRYCRDRLVAVCEYYVFIRNVRQGYYSGRTNPDLYHEAMRLRLQMFYARMGALPWTLRSIGVKDKTIGAAPPPNIALPPPPSESSPLPRSTTAESLSSTTKRRSSTSMPPNTEVADEPERPASP